jgi:hypothetical protein
MTKTQSPIYLAGRSAALQGLGYSACPYKGADKLEWKKGYNVGNQKARKQQRKAFMKQEQQHA